MNPEGQGHDASDTRPRSGAMSVLAGVVVYHPDTAHLARLVGRVAPDVREVVVYANSDLDAGTEAALAAACAPTPLHVLRPGGNRGLGAAYNALLARAEAAGDAHLFLLDQDSLPAADTIPRLARARAALEAVGERPAVIGPQPLDPAGAPMKIAAGAARTLGGEPVRPTAFLISSGSLVAVAAAAAVGPFRADFFIDAIDLEWCMRARARGFSVWIADGVRMDHVLGQGVIRLPLGLRMVRQPPRRLYTYLRNQAAMLRLAHVPLAHKGKWLASLPLRLAVYLAHDRGRAETRSAIRRGLLDGLRNRLGAP